MSDSDRAETVTEILMAFLEDEAKTRKVAHHVASLARAGDIVALEGDLGAGKSTFARAFIRARMQNDMLDVPSPTFTLVQIYEPEEGPALLHADLYRLSSPDDVEDLGLYDEMDRSIMLIEWPDRMPDDWWQIALRIELTIPEGGDGDARTVRLSSIDNEWGTRLQAITAQTFR